MPPRRKAIVIGCPQHGKPVRGTYPCDARGRYAPLGADGDFLLDYVQCDHDNGRCMQTLCALHRYNRRGPGTWYPDHVRAAREPAPRGRSRRADPEAGLF
ncbi:MAG: hypothetical protein KGY99_00805 [Phycisphaerae bacterium]|nr:hypothetical protein [Phycisphaerae bacterium]